MPGKYYITTPIYYVTDKPHIGHLYTTLAADVQARYQRACGKEVWFLTGTDEHGQKIEKKAKEAGKTPKELADEVHQRYIEAWKFFGVTYSDFIRTSEPRHKEVVFQLIEKLMKQGDVYLDEYEGLYCVPCEAYWTESQLEQGNLCPNCQRPLEKLKEESYFFKMSAYAPKLLNYIKENPDFIYPESRRNEVVSFLEQGVKDISISRTTIEWGIAMPQDGKAKKQHKVYVWFDALTNYYSALDPLNPASDKLAWWPHAIHLIGKDIIRFHAVYWPTFLMALGLPLPKQIVAHGWITVAQQKMSKSLGNVIEPVSLANEVGKEGLRYFLFREFIFGSDGEYTPELLYQRINSDLANDYGNAISRVCSMIQKYFGGTLDAGESASSHLKQLIEENRPLYHQSMNRFQFHKSIEAILKVLGGVNRSIEETAPWKLAKSNEPTDQARLRDALNEWHEALRIVSLWFSPFLPEATTKALGYLGATSKPTDLQAGDHWLESKNALKVGAVQPLFPRLEWKPS